jgi:RNA polymerase nonessential primary-like sigma factor
MSTKYAMQKKTFKPLRQPPSDEKLPDSNDAPARKPPKTRDEFNTISLYLEEIRAYPLLTAEEEIHFGRLNRQGDEQCRRLMIVSNLRLVVKIARGYYNRGMAFLDLVEEGNLGLIRAVEKFDPERGCRFSTYASWWIRQSIERGIMDHGHTVGLPIHIQKEFFHYNRTARELAKEGSQNPGADDVAEFLGVPVERVRNILEWCKRTTISTSASGDDGDASPLEFIADEMLVDPADALEYIDEHNHLHSLFAQLSARERHIVQCRYGLDGEDQSTLADIGKRLGITNERVRQIQVKALHRLREMLS